MTTNRDDLVRAICTEVANAVLSTPPKQLEAFDRAIADAERIFVFGEGRSGLVLRMGAMRLVHLVGDATTPAIRPGDVQIVDSGAGVTTVTVLIVEAARKAGATFVTITASAGSRLAKLAETVVLLGTPAKRGAGTGQSIQPGGTLFEQGMLAPLDSVFLPLAGDKAEDHLAQRLATMEYA